ncbi:MAG: homogentisate phytyltransferase [Timaviella obliquedivisa GSE-PSE-MK23-08B]|jgi:homogentisate phytyltransferase/homogentisate geranylgeranyltransferase|nr:homogentisate phytyltransferase [Timaviella obliquedivisa GSE-PSE-MK23-08B]
MSRISPSKPLSAGVYKTNIVQRQFPWLYAFWKFSRPHTVIGTTLSVLGLALMAWALNGGQQSYPPFLIVLTLVACLCGNVYIVGLNQLEDVDIDRINKPHLPLASGEFTRSMGQGIVVFTGFLALTLSSFLGTFLTFTIWASLLIGTAYSLPPIRLKRFPVWASLCIFTVRGAIVNLGLFLSYTMHLGASTKQQFLGVNVPEIPPIVWVLTAFIVVFTFAIAIFKDIPDLEGDRLYHISTFTVRLGAPAVFNLSRWVITACYLGAIGAGLLLPNVNPVFLVGTHGLALMALWVKSFRVNLQNKEAIAQFYQFIWKLFFLEYLLFPLSCVLW